MEAEPIIGIDLGTTNSEVAVIENGRPRVLAEEGRAILPSIVGLAEDGRLLVGEPARNQWLLAPARTIRSVKRRMGEDVKLPMGDREFSPQEVSAMILRTLKGRAEQHLGRPVGKAVITVPAYFNDAQRQATREAGELAGLEVVRILNEPTAAALVYEADQTASQTILVYDLGGGTFDVSIVRIEKGVLEVLSSHGDTHLGGDDFDALLIQRVADEFQKAHGIDLRADARAHSRLWRAVELAKIRLSTEPYAQISEEFIAEKDGLPLHLSIELSRHEYEQMIRPLIERTLEAAQTALNGAHLTAAQIDRIVLAGGATRTPLVGEELQRRTGCEPHQEVDPDLCVAMGAAIQAGIIQGAEVGAVLVDVTPHTFGVSYLGERNGMPYPYCFSPIIHKNTPLPTSRTEVYYTVYEDQESAEVEVFQGDYPDALKNVRIGQFVVEGLSRGPANSPITCRLDLDLNGMLKVTAREKKTGLEKQVVINNAMSRFEIKEMDAAAHRLRELFGDEEWDEQGEESTEADRTAGDSADSSTAAILQRARALLPEIPAEDRDEVIGLIERIDDARKAGEPARASSAVRDLEDILFYLEESR
ncbi:MAG TPA: Hsp70 family protein [Phycisphaerae bacterium]|nr:Hsp70 family protein [Phycisphaerae bacterium]